MKNNKKAFTMVEILAVIVIISILAVLIIIAVSTYIKDNKETYDENLEKQVEISGKNYWSNNPDKKPVSKGDTSYVTLKELSSQGLLSKEVKDADSNSCMEESYVIAEKIDEDRIDYIVCLKCGEDNFTNFGECSVREKIYIVKLDHNGATTTGTKEISTKYKSSNIEPETIEMPNREYEVSGFETAQKRKSDGAVISSTATLKSTYTLKGWYTTKTSTKQVLTNEQKPKYNNNIEGYTDASGKWIKDQNPTTLYAQWESDSVTLPTIEKTGYTCGWTNKETGLSIKYQSGATHTPKQSKKLYGVCKPNEYTVEYYSYDGKTKYGSSKHTYDEISELKTISSLGATSPNSEAKFYGWAEIANSTTKIKDNGQNVINLTSENNGIIKLYAIWKTPEKIYTATTQKNVSSAIGTKKEVKCTISAVYNAAVQDKTCQITLPDNPYTLTGWTFNGWVNAGSAITTSKESGIPINSTISISNNINIVATWKKTSTSTWYYYNGTTQKSTTSNCTMYNGKNSCNFSVPGVVSDSSGPSSTEYKGVSTQTGSTAITTDYTNTITTYYAVYQKTITSTFYYNKNTTCGTGVIATTTNKGIRSATTNGSTYKVTNPNISIPSAVTSSVGQYNSDYNGVSKSLESMTLTTPTTENTTYYANYSSAVKIYMPTTQNQVSSTTIYRNEYFASKSQMSAKLSTSATGTSNMTSISGIYGQLKGFNQTINQSTYSSVENSAKTCEKEYYAISKNSEDATIYYNNNKTSGSITSTKTTAPVTSTYYCKTTSETTVSHGTTTTIPSEVTSSVGKYNSANVGVSNSLSSMTKTNTLTGGNTYYAVYSSEVTIYKPISETTASSTKAYRNEYFTSTNEITTKLGETANQTSDIENIGTTYGTLIGFANKVNTNSNTYASISKLRDSSEIAAYARTTNSITITYNANGGSGAPDVQTTTRTTYCTNTTTAKTVGDTKISNAVPTLKGHTFNNRWNTKSDGSGTNYNSSTSYAISSSTTIYAQWSVSKYTVKYTCGSGTGTPPDNQNVNYGETITINGNGGSCQKTGHTFSKWQDPTGDTTWTGWNGKWIYENGSYGITNNILTLEAKYTANSYTIEYYSYDGKTKYGSSKHVYGTEQALKTITTLNATGPSDKSFYGWATTENSTTKTYNDGQKVNNLTSENNGIIKLYAIWKTPEKIYTATTQKNVSSATGTNDKEQCTIPAAYNGTTQEKSCTITLPSNPYTLSGWTFNGWVNGGSSTTTSQKSGTAENKTMSINGDTNIIATWKKTLTATWYYYSDKVTSTTSNCTIYNGSTSCKASVPSEVSESKGPYNNSYIGYATSVNTMTSKTSAPTLTANTSYYAVYRSNVTIYRPTSSTLAGNITRYRNSYFSSTSTIKTVLATDSSDTDAITSISDLYKSLYGFTESINSSTVTWKEITDIQNSKITTFYTISKYDITITYNANGGSGAPSKQTTTRYIYCESNSTATSTGNTTISNTTPKKTGYTFQEKWNTKSDGTGTSYSPGSTYTITSDLTLYAQWSIKSKSITYKIQYGINYSLPSKTYIANGQILGGTSATTSTTIGTDGMTSQTKSSSLKYDTSEEIEASPAYPDDRYTGSVSCTNGLTATLTEGSTGTERTDTINVTNDSDTTTSSVCTITYTPKWEGIAYGTYTAGNTISYGGTKYNWTIKKDNGDNVGLAYNAVSGNGKYEDAPSTLTTNILDKFEPLKNDYSKGGLKDQSGNYITSNSGISTNLTATNCDYNYWTSSSQFYNRAARHYYTRILYKFIYGTLQGRGEQALADLTELEHYHEVSSTSTIAVGIRNIKGTKYSTTNGAVTFQDYYATYTTADYYQSRWGKKIKITSGNTNNVGYLTTAWKREYENNQWVWTGYNDGDSSTQGEVNNSWRITAYRCGGTNQNHGKAVVYRYYNASNFYFGNEQSKVGYNNGDFALTEPYAYKANDKYWWGAYAGYANTDCVDTNKRIGCKTSEEKTLSNYTRYHREYQFNNFDNNGYCYKPRNYTLSDLKIDLYYRPYIIVRER